MHRWEIRPNAQLAGTPYYSPKLHTGPCSSVGMQWGTERQTDERVPIYISCRQRLTWNVIIKFCSKLLLKTKQYSWKIRLPSEWPFSFSTCSAGEPPRTSGTGFYTQDGRPSCHPTNSVEAPKRTQNTEPGKSSDDFILRAGLLREDQGAASVTPAISLMPVPLPLLTNARSQQRSHCLWDKLPQGLTPASTILKDKFLWPWRSMTCPPLSGLKYISNMYGRLLSHHAHSLQSNY